MRGFKHVVKAFFQCVKPGCEGITRMQRRYMSNYDRLISVLLSNSDRSLPSRIPARNCCKALLRVSLGGARGAEVCKLREVAAAGCESLLASAEAQGVEVQIRIPDEIELPLERNRMERVLSNRVGNALEMMPEGGRIQISAAAQKRIRSGGRARYGSGDRAGDSRQPVRAVRQRGEEERAGAGVGAFAADGAGPRGRHVGGIGAGRGRVLPGAAAGGGVRRGARMQNGRAKPISASPAIRMAPRGAGTAARLRRVRVPMVVLP
jgi:hypothetical protein